MTHPTTYFPSLPFLFIDYFPTQHQRTTLRHLFQEKYSKVRVGGVESESGDDAHISSKSNENGPESADSQQKGDAGAKAAAFSCVFLLSHAHTDHMQNIGWDQVGTMYCSKWTARLVRRKLDAMQNGAKASKTSSHRGRRRLLQQSQRGKVRRSSNKGDSSNRLKIVEMELNQLYSIEIPGFHAPLQVQMLRAHHCIGSCMFVLIHPSLEGPVLYTGDFRFENLASLQQELEPFQNAIRTLILDSTFADSAVFPRFPQRSHAISQLVQFIQKLDRNASIFMDLSILGTEPILLEIACQLREKVHINKQNLTPRRYQELKCMRFLHFMLTDKASDARITLLDRQLFNKKVEAAQKRKSNSNTMETPDPVFIRCTTMWTRQIYENLCGMSGSAEEIGRDQLRCVNGIFHCLYSIHSSWAEIVEVVRYLGSKNIRELCASAAIEQKYIPSALLQVAQQRKRKRESVEVSEDVVGVYDYSLMDAERSVHECGDEKRLSSSSVEHSVSIPTASGADYMTVTVSIDFGSDRLSESQQATSNCSVNLSCETTTCSVEPDDELEDLLADLD